METKDHLNLAKRLGNDMGLRGTREILFVLGNVVPDFNPFSYITISYSCLFGGHTYGYRKKFIKEKLELWEKGGLSWYQLGNVIHYLTDAFTKPHNEKFEVKLAEHTRYESLLHQYFKEHIDGFKLNNPWEDNQLQERRRGGKWLQYWVEEQHQRYLEKERELVDDFYFINHITRSICLLMEKPYIDKYT